MTNPNSLAAQVLSDPSASYWLKDAVRTALDRDPVDATHDVQALLAVVKDNLVMIGGGR